MENTPIPYQVDNPNDFERHEYFKYILYSTGRPEDYNNVIELLSPPADILNICSARKGNGIKVGVIGAGEAGLASSFELRKIGCDVTIFEASCRIGGRIYTRYFDENKRYYGELGAMRIGISHETTWHYINQFKLKTSPFVTNNVNSLFFIREKRARNDIQGLSVMKNIYPQYRLTPEEKRIPWNVFPRMIVEKYLKSLSPQLRTELLNVKKYYSPEIQRIDNLSLRDAYESIGLSQDAISMIGYLSAFEKSLFYISLTEILQETYTSDFSYNYRINGGTSKLPEAFYNSLIDKTSRYGTGNVYFKMNCPVDGIYMAPGGNAINIEYRDTATGEKHIETFDYCICAVPFTSLRRIRIEPLFSVLKMQAINEMNSSPAQKVLFFMKDRFWEMWPPSKRIVGGTTLTDLPNTTVVYPSDHSLPVPNAINSWTLKPNTSPLEPGVLLASYNLNLDALILGNENCKLLKNDVSKYIERIHNLPDGFIKSKLISWLFLNWMHVQYIWGAVTFTLPGQRNLFSYAAIQPEMNERLFFAGEHVSQKHGWQQGALRTGMEAANSIAERIIRR